MNYHSPLFTHPSKLTPHNSPFITHPSSLTLHHAPFITPLIPHPSLHPSSLTLQYTPLCQSANYCNILQFQQQKMCIFFNKIKFWNFWKNIYNFRKFSKNFIKIFDFIFAKFSEIKNNFVKISCFAKFFKCSFAATL